MNDVRHLKRRLEVLKKQPPKVTKKSDSGDRLLNAAKDHLEERRRDTERNIYDCSYEAASDLINLGRGRVLSYGGIGPGVRMGAGRWVYQEGDWQKKE